ncbi:retrovirus-related pol polyprotein from transposon TNT 1-94 [Tanacetum coccineum]
MNVIPLPGASHHMTGIIEDLSNLKDKVQWSVELPDGNIAMAKKEGDVCFDNGFVLRNVLYDLTLRTVIGAGERMDGGLFYFREIPPTKAFKTTTTTIPFDTWHKQLVGTPQKNGRVERKHRHILNVARALRFQSSLPIDFWGECILIAAYLINHTPSSILNGKTPYTVLHSVEPPYNHLRTFGCLCYAHTKTGDKFASCSRKCVFVGYPYGQKGCSVTIPVNENTIPHDDGNRVVVNENTIPHDDGDQVVGNEGITPSPQSHNVDTSEQVQAEELGRGHPITAEREPVTYSEAVKDKRWRSAMDSELEDLEQNKTWTIEKLPPDKKALGCNETFTPVAKMVTVRVFLAIAAAKQWELHQMDVHNVFLHGDLEEEIFLNYTTLTHQNLSNMPRILIPLRPILGVLHQVVGNEGITPSPQSHNVDTGEQVQAEDELKDLEQNKTWTIEKLPPDKKALGCKWVYKKYKSDGTIERFKARLVILAKQWEHHQMDVHNAFLHGDLEEEVFMKLPPGLHKGQHGEACKLCKSLYGLRQAPRCWSSKLSSALKKYGFVQSYSDYSLFILQQNGVQLNVLVYVDDLIVSGNDHEAITQFKTYLSNYFHMKDLGNVKYFLGIEVARAKEGIFLCQRKYALDIIFEVGLLGAKPAKIPMEQNHRLGLAQGRLFEDPEQYRSYADGVTLIGQNSQPTGDIVEDMVVRLRLKRTTSLAQKDTIVKPEVPGDLLQTVTQPVNCAMILRVNLGSTNNQWLWIDTGATRQLSADMKYQGEGDVYYLTMTSEKELKLTNVLYVLEIRKNLDTVMQIGYLTIKILDRLLEMVYTRRVSLYLGSLAQANVIASPWIESEFITLDKCGERRNGYVNS